MSNAIPGNRAGILTQVTEPGVKSQIPSLEQVWLYIPKLLPLGTREAGGSTLRYFWLI